MRVGERYSSADAPLAPSEGSNERTASLKVGEQASSQRSREGWQGIGRRAMRSGRRAAGESAEESFDAGWQKRMGEFQDIYDQETIERDIRYVERTERSFAPEGERRKSASKRFEELFLTGVRRGRWLGDIAQAADGEAPFRVSAEPATKFDDFTHRVDAYATLHFREPLEDEETEMTLERAHMGFDVTLNGDYGAVMDKLTRSCNDGARMPFGFSSLKYYDDDGEHGSVGMLPRYMIGVSGYDMRDAIRAATKDERTGQIRDFGLYSGRNLASRFKVLSEIRAENVLYQAMLPDELDTPELKLASAQLYAVDQELNSALAACTKELVVRKALPPHILAEIERASQGQGGQGGLLGARKIIEEFYLKQGRLNFQEERQRRERWQGYPDSGDSAHPVQDTFVQIMDCCRELTEMAYRGELNNYRAPQARNRSIKRG